jgi:predicted MPP superfamily phosphohydrolase
MKSVFALVLAFLLGFLSIPVTVSAAEQKQVKVAVLSDVHIFPSELTGGYCDAFWEENTNDGKLTGQTESLLVSALAAIEQRAAEGEVDYLLISGDLTRQGEYAGHTKLAACLEAFEAATGVQVAVIPGNHDINNDSARDYSSGAAQPARFITPEEFKVVYAKLGYDLAEAAYTPPAGEYGGGLSYTAKLGDFRLIAIDSCKYSDDYGGHSTGGKIGRGLMAWVLEQCARANAANEPILGMLHHNLTEHIGLEESLFKDYMLDDYRAVRETLADAGMHFALTGHIHVEEIGKAVSDSGETLFDISTAALQTYPCTFKTIRITAIADGTITADVASHAADEALPVTVNGVTYPQPFRKTAFALTYWTAEEKGLAAFAAQGVAGALHGQLDNIRRAGGILAFLKQSGVDLEQILRDALGGGLTVGEWNVFTEKNILGLLDDVLAQIDGLYINNPDRLDALLGDVFENLFSLQLSELPCTRFIETLGFGDPNKPGTLEDFGNSALAYIYSHADDYSTDAFFMDVVDKAESGELLDLILDEAVAIILDDVLCGELLPALKLRPQSMFVSQIGKDTLGCLLNLILEALCGTASRSGVAQLLRSMGVNALVGVAKPAVALALPAELKNGINSVLNLLIHEMITAHSPTGHTDATLVYDGSIPVALDDRNSDFRAPFDVSAALGDNGTSAKIIWYTKRSVTATDIQLENAPVGLHAVKTTENAVCLVKQLDLGVAKIMGEELQATKHIVMLEGLIPGQTYTYEIGDFARGWSGSYVLNENGTAEIDGWQQFINGLATAWQWISAIFGGLLCGLLGL